MLFKALYDAGSIIKKYFIILDTGEDKASSEQQDMLDMADEDDDFFDEEDEDCDEDYRYDFDSYYRSINTIWDSQMDGEPLEKMPDTLRKLLSKISGDSHFYYKSKGELTPDQYYYGVQTFKNGELVDVHVWMNDNKTIIYQGRIAKYLGASTYVVSIDHPKTRLLAITSQMKRRE